MLDLSAVDTVVKWSLKLSKTRRVDWQVVRGVGELQVLTRVSYLMLVLVPILAALWPGVRLAVDRYNNAASKATEQATELAEDLRGLSRGVSSVQGTDGLADRLRAKADLIESAGKQVRPVKEPAMPTALVLAFLAALFVMIAHAMYQVWCPEMVQRQSPADYARSVCETFVSTQAKGMVEEGKKFLSQGFHEEAPMPSWVAEELTPQCHEVLKEGGDVRLDGLFRFDEKAGGTKDIVKWAADRDSDLVTEGARAQYYLACRSNSVLSQIAILMYGIGLVLLVVIIGIQTLNVLRAAGWIEPADAAEQKSVGEKTAGIFSVNSMVVSASRPRFMSRDDPFPTSTTTAEGVEHQSPASRSPRWVHDHPNGVVALTWESLCVVGTGEANGTQQA